MFSFRSIVVVLLVVLSSLNLAIAGTDEAGLAFLSKKKTEDGVVELPSGLM